MKEQIYIVRKGDTLHKIAKSHRCEVNRISTLNHLTNINLFEVGQKLKLTEETFQSTQAPEKKQKKKKILLYECSLWMY